MSTPQDFPNASNLSAPDADALSAYDDDVVSGGSAESERNDADSGSAVPPDNSFGAPQDPNE